MRLWSIHPRYLDPRGLVALWREALLARAVLRGRGYAFEASKVGVVMRKRAGGVEAWER